MSKFKCFKGFFGKLAMLFSVLFVSVFTAMPAWCAPVIDDIYTAGSIDSIEGKVIPMAIGIVGIAMVSVAVAVVGAYLRKTRGAVR